MDAQKRHRHKGILFISPNKFKREDSDQFLKEKEGGRGRGNWTRGRT
jgi:hypothetical protein